jgi:hypothetical protein
LALVLCMGTARALQAQGGPPLETDDPGTPGSGHVELNISVEAERESAGTSYDVPRLDANLGVGARLQLKLEVPWRVATAPAEPARTGIGNVVLGVKWRFAQTGAVAVSTYPQLTLGGSESAGMKGVADRETTLLMPVEVAWNVGPVSLNAEVGYQRGQGSSELVYGLALAREAGRALELLGECHGSGNTDLTEQGVLCGVGFRWVLQRTVGLLVAYATGVIGSAEDRPDHRLYSGVQLRW